MLIVIKCLHLRPLVGENQGYIVMLRARMFRSLIPVLMIIKKHNDITKIKTRISGKSEFGKFGDFSSQKCKTVLII